MFTWIIYEGFYNFYFNKSIRYLCFIFQHPQRSKMPAFWIPFFCGDNLLFTILVKNSVQTWNDDVSIAIIEETFHENWNFSLSELLILKTNWPYLIFLKPLNIFQFMHSEHIVSVKYCNHDLCVFACEWARDIKNRTYAWTSHLAIKL